jgi:hypothetical protein
LYLFSVYHVWISGNSKNPRNWEIKLNYVWFMIVWFYWGLMIVRGAERDRPRVFSNWCTKSWSLKFSHIPVEAEIDFCFKALPVVISWSLEHQRHVWIVYEWLACSGIASISPTKSTCMQFKVKLEIYVRAVTDGCSWSGSTPWCIWIVFGWSGLKEIKPKSKFDSYGSLESLEK